MAGFKKLNKIVEQCNARPRGTTVKQWLADNDINEKTYYYWLRRVRREVYSQLNTGLPSVSGQDKLSVSFAEIPVGIYPAKRLIFFKQMRCSAQVRWSSGYPTPYPTGY